MLQARKAPKQKRAKDRIQSILNAAKNILTHEGYSEFSTNRVAKAADVNIASVYQYFPNKESLICTIHQQLDQDIEKTCLQHQQRWTAAGDDLINSLYQELFDTPTASRLMQAVECAIITTPSLNHLQHKISEQLSLHIARALKFRGSQWHQPQCFSLGQIIHQLNCQHYFNKHSVVGTPLNGNDVFQQSCTALIQQAFTTAPAYSPQEISAKLNIAPQSSAL